MARGYATLSCYIILQQVETCCYKIESWLRHYIYTSISNSLCLSGVLNLCPYSSPRERRLRALNQ